MGQMDLFRDRLRQWAGRSVSATNMMEMVRQASAHMDELEEKLSQLSVAEQEQALMAMSDISGDMARVVQTYSRQMRLRSRPVPTPGTPNPAAGAARSTGVTPDFIRATQEPREGGPDGAAGTPPSGTAVPGETAIQEGATKGGASGLVLPTQTPVVSAQDWMVREMVLMQEEIASLAASQPNVDQMMSTFGRMQGMLMTLRQQVSTSSPADMKVLARDMGRTMSALAPLMESYLQSETGTSQITSPRPGP
jgi:hypothetical protein